MPLYKTLHPNSQTTVKIWKITESYKDLMQSIAEENNLSETVFFVKENILLQLDGLHLLVKLIYAVMQLWLLHMLFLQN